MTEQPAKPNALDIDAALRASLVAEAKLLFEKRPQWPVFYVKVFGPQGLIHQMFPSADDRQEFTQFEEYRQLKTYLDDLRSRIVGYQHRVITVRLPPELHEALKAEAHRRHTSINTLAVAKLLQELESDALLETLERDSA